MSDIRKIKLGTLYREFSLNRAEIDEKNRTVPLSFSSETPVERYFGIEILDHSLESVDMARLQNSAPVLVNHDDNDQVGVVESARIGADRKGRAVVRFGQSQRAQEIFQDVKDGIRTAVSVGYRVMEMLTESVKGGVETMRATKWQPFEISIVPLPADTSVGVGRKQAEDETTCVVRSLTEQHKTKVMPENQNPAQGGAATATVPSPVTSVTVEDMRKAESLRAREIRAIAQRSGIAELIPLAEQAIENGTAKEDFQNEAFLRMCKGAKPVQNSSPIIGMSSKEVRSYSLVRAINRLANNKPVDGLEAEASDAVAQMSKRSPTGFFIPHDLILSKRSVDGLNVTTAGDGGNLVATNLLGSSMIDQLRNKMILPQLGTTNLSGLIGNVAIPRVNSGATAYWLSEAGAVTPTKQAFGQVALTPHTLCAMTAFTKQLLAQSSVDVESLVRNDLMKVLAIERDRAALCGSGSDGQTLGICSIPTGLSTAVTFASPTAPTYAEMVEFWKNVAESNADNGDLAFVMTPTAAYRMMTTQVASNTGIFIWKDGKVNGYKSIASKNMQSTPGNVLFGNFGDLVLADWAGWDVTVDTSTLSDTGQVRVVIMILVDNNVRHAASFCVSSNAIA